MKRNVYDFDGTIYRGDSTADFFVYCIGRYPKILPDFLGSAVLFAGMGLGLVEKTRAKERFYRFLRFVPDPERSVIDFWQSHEINLEKWYLSQKSADDLIISASPEFLLSPICRQLGVALLGSRVDPKTGKTDGINCHDAEKVRRMREAYPDTQIEKFYSDSASDTPLAALAKDAYFVRRGKIRPFFNVVRWRPQA